MTFSIDSVAKIYVYREFDSVSRDQGLHSRFINRFLFLVFIHRITKGFSFLQTSVMTNPKFVPIIEKLAFKIGLKLNG